MQYFAVDVTKSTTDEVQQIIKQSEVRFGPIMLFVPCAGMSIPSLFLNSDIETYRQLMDLNYFGTLAYLLPISKKMASRGKGHICLVSSVLGFMSCPGYSPYIPTKFAVKGLADSIREELAAYGVSVSIFLPGEMDTPGLQIENKIKSDLTKEVEGSGESVTAEEASSMLLKGLAKGEYCITTSLTFKMLQLASIGPVARFNVISDILLAPLSIIMQHVYVVMTRWKVQKASRRKLE